MRNKSFVGIHRGGTLTAENHRLLIAWAVECVRHGMEISGLEQIDPRALDALQVAGEWEHGRATVGEARKAAFSAHTAARDCAEKSVQAISRACGHAAATAHMVDHALKARDYVLKGIKLQLDDDACEKEILWQSAHADARIRDLVMIKMNEPACRETGKECR